MKYDASFVGEMIRRVTEDASKPLTAWEEGFMASVTTLTRRRKMTDDERDEYAVDAYDRMIDAGVSVIRWFNALQSTGPVRCTVRIAGTEYDFAATRFDDETYSAGIRRLRRQLYFGCDRRG